MKLCAAGTLGRERSRRSISSHTATATRLMSFSESISPSSYRGRLGAVVGGHAIGMRSGKLGPDAVPVVGAQVHARNGTGCQPLYVDAALWRNGATVRRHLPEICIRHFQCGGQLPTRFPVDDICTQIHA